MSIMTIRSYQPGDFDALRLCLRELQKHIRSFEWLPIIRSEEDFDADAYLRATIEIVREREGVIFLALKDEKVIGCVVGTIPLATDPIDHLESFPVREGYINELIVLEEARSSGAGRLLIQEVERYFRSKECAFIRVNCFAPNVRSLEFYHHCGYEDRLISLIKPLRDDS